MGCSGDWDVEGRECVGNVVGMWSVSTNRMWGMAVIYCWDVVSQSTYGDVGDDSNILLGRGQSEYQCGCRG